MGSGPVRRALAVAVAVAAVLLAACGGGDDASEPSSTTAAPEAVDAGPFTVDPATARGPGTELLEGLPVVDGSVLLGAPFPDAGGEGGFLALLLVTGDPVTVFNAYSDTAGGLGMVPAAAGGCVPIAGGAGMSCARRLVDPSDGEVLSLRLERRAAPGGWVSHLGVRYQPPGTEEPGSVPPGGVTPPTDPLPTVGLPAEVDPVDPANVTATVAPFGPVLAVPEGATLTGPAGVCGCGPGWSVVFAVDDPAAVDAVVADLAAQLGAGEAVPDQGVADLGLVPGGFAQIRTGTVGDTPVVLVAFATG